VYVVLPIALAFILPTWFLLRRFTQIWVNRPITIIESIYSGITAWLFLISLLMWFSGIALTFVEFISTHETEDIWALIFSMLLTGYGIDFIIRSSSELNINDTKEFIKEAIQFRHSAQHRLDLLALMQMRRIRKARPVVGSDPQSLERARLEAKLIKGKELDIQLAMLREGKSVDISEVWHSHAKMHSTHPFYLQVEEARIEPNRKRLSLFVEFEDLNETQLKDEMTILRFNRQVYDFLQSMNSESWLKTYSQFFESYFLICKAKRINQDGIEQLYPFMKVGVLVEELRKLEGSYFNPRKLSEIAALAFDNGAQV
jgi:hypothetical protein